MLQDQSPRSLFDGHPRTLFYLGLFVGVSSVTTIGLAVILGLVLSGKTVGPALAAGNGQVAVAPTPSQDQPTPAQQPPAAPVKPVDEKNDHIRGPKNAKVTLIEYSDFQCPYCLRHSTTLEQVLKDYPKTVRLVYRNFPLSFHPEAQKAAEATECAGKQGKFWEMHDFVFKANESGTMNVAKWKEGAQQLKLNVNDFNKCLDSGETAAHIAQDEAEGQQAGVQGTPGTFVNGTLIEGAVPYDQLKQVIDKKLK